MHRAQLLKTRRQAKRGLPHDDAPALFIVFVNAHLDDIILGLDVCSTCRQVDQEALLPSKTQKPCDSARHRSLAIQEDTAGRALTELLVNLELHRETMTVPAARNIIVSARCSGNACCRSLASYPNLRGQ